MPFDILACPQCGASLPRQARWRVVTCPSCGSTVMRQGQMVEAKRFRDAYSHAQVGNSPNSIHAGDLHYQLLFRLGQGVSSTVYLAERLGSSGERVVLKVAKGADEDAILESEGKTLHAMAASDPLAVGFATGRITPVGWIARSEGPRSPGRRVLAFARPPGYWGTLADVRAANPRGIDPRHGIWMWRRALGLLSLIHGAGWVHGHLCAEHLLVHPGDHGLLAISWGKAERISGNSQSLMAPTPARDLAQVSWTIRELLCGSAAIDDIPAQVPSPMANLLDRCCNEPSWVAAQGALGIDAHVKEASRATFGSPTFLPFNPAPDMSGHIR